MEKLLMAVARAALAASRAAGCTKLGTTDGRVRISVGIEDVEGIIADLEQALKG